MALRTEGDARDVPVGLNVGPVLGVVVPVRLGDCVEDSEAVPADEGDKAWLRDCVIDAVSVPLRVCADDPVEVGVVVVERLRERDGVGVRVCEAEDVVTWLADRLGVGEAVMLLVRLGVTEELEEPVLDSVLNGEGVAVPLTVRVCDNDAVFERLGVPVGLAEIVEDGVRL